MSSSRRVGVIVQSARRGPVTPRGRRGLRGGGDAARGSRGRAGNRSASTCRVDVGPVDHPARRGPPPPAGRPEATRERDDPRLDADQADACADLGEVEVGGAHDLHAVDVDELMVDDVGHQQRLAVALFERTEIEHRGRQDDGVRSELGDPSEGHERAMTGHAGDEASEGGIGVTMPSGRRRRRLGRSGVRL